MLHHASFFFYFYVSHQSSIHSRFLSMWIIFMCLYYSYTCYMLRNFIIGVWLVHSIISLFFFFCFYSILLFFFLIFIHISRFLLFAIFIPQFANYKILYRIFIYKLFSKIFYYEFLFFLNYYFYFTLFSFYKRIIE